MTYPALIALRTQNPGYTNRTIGQLVRDFGWRITVRVYQESERFR